jgi:hypothetical protein
VGGARELPREHLPEPRRKGTSGELGRQVSQASDPTLHEPRGQFPCVASPIREAGRPGLRPRRFPALARSPPRKAAPCHLNERAGADLQLAGALPSAKARIPRSRIGGGRSRAGRQRTPGRPLGADRCARPEASDSPETGNFPDVAAGWIYTFPVPRTRGLIAKNAAARCSTKGLLSQMLLGGGLASRLLSYAVGPPGPPPGGVLPSNQILHPFPPPQS